MKRKYYGQLIVILLILTIIPVLSLSTIQYFLTTHSMEQEIRRTNQVSLENTKNVIETKILTIRQDFTNYLLNDRTFDDLKRGLLDSVDLKNIIFDFRQFNSKYDYIGEIFSYDKRSNHILTSVGGFDPDYFFNLLQAEAMNPLLTAPKLFELHSLPHFSTGTQQFPATAIVSTVPLRNPSFDIFFAIIMNNKKITEDLNRLHGANNGFVVVTDDEDRLLFSSKGNPVPQMTLDRLHEELLQDGQGKVKWDDEEYIIVKAEDSALQWTYRTVIPRSSIILEYRTIQLISLLLTFIIVVAALILSFLSGKRLYRPIHQLISKFALDESPQSKMNELSFLDSKIQTMINDNKDMQLELLESAKVLQLDMLRKLVTGQIEPQSVKELASKYGLQLSHMYFAVLILEAKPGFEPAAAEELLAQSWHHYYSLEEENKQIVLLNFNSGDTIEKVVALFAGSPVFLISGMTVESLERIRESYEQALQGLKYRKLHDSFEYLDASDIHNMSMQAGQYLYPSELESKLTLSIESGQQEQTRTLIRSVLEDFIHEQAPLCYVQQNAENLVSYTREMCKKLNWPLQEVFQELYSFEFVRSQSLNIAYYRDQIERMFEQFLSYGERHAQLEMDPFFVNILNYIDEHYMKDISLNTLADEFNMSYHYLSKMFKQHTGLVYVEYISKLRVDKAKQLIELDRYKIKEIAGLVGYNNAVSFNRNFKKYVGISPGQYHLWVTRKEADSNTEQ